MENEIVCRISKRELCLLEFMREKHKFGKIEVVVHAGQPRKIIIQNPPEIILDNNSDL
jgi:hypothetical protein